MTVVRARAVTKTFGAGRAARTVLRGVDLDVAAGELVAVVGRSGSGKSTLLHVLAGLDRADSGTIELAGGRVDGARDAAVTALRARAVGFVFQFFHLVPELTGEENVLLPTRVRGGSSNGAAARAFALMERLDLRPVARSLPHELSGGEQQRFAIARALVNDPAVVLADEPIGNLDPASGAVVLSLLRAVADEGRAVAMVTHQPEVAAIADRVLRLEDGRLVG
ncbi:MAG TPA: ABC transporter ATP-binding protein [Solirubrobacteraceae bacterium]|jgi:ABC-type lipoprotein export system ATPase subunit|nr:ABC transporter ATP-binding protein [Solirubrobacteraceae bacterium]